MGLKLRYQVFRHTTASAVYGAYLSFYESRGRPLQVTGADWQRIDFHREIDDWVVVSLDGGWEWKERRELQLSVSSRLWCPGFLIFVYDGDYWGYEFFDHGEVFDRFVQEATGEPIGFPNANCRERPDVLASHLPHLRARDIAPYLVQKHDFAIPEGMDVSARPGDEFRRFDECGVLDFLRMLGVDVVLQGGYVQVRSPVFRSAFNVGNR